MTEQALDDSQTQLARDIVRDAIRAIPSSAPPDVNMWTLVHWLRDAVRWRYADPAHWVSLEQLLRDQQGNCRALSTALVALLIEAGYGEQLTWGVGFQDNGDRHVWPIYWGPDGPAHLDASTCAIDPGQSPVDAPDSPLVASYSLPL